MSTDDDLKLLLDSTRAIVHMARTIITIKREIATVAKAGGFDEHGLLAMIEDNERRLNGLGDILNGMDAVTEDDAWVNEIMEAVARRCGDAPSTGAETQQSES